MRRPAGHTNPMLLAWLAGGQTASGVGLLAAGDVLSGAIILTIGVVYTTLLVAGKIGAEGGR